MKRRLFAGLALLVATAGALAQGRVLTIITPSAPGGAVDAVTRAIGDELAKRLGQTVIVENRPGATGMLAAQAVARAAPDGHTLLLTHSAPLTNAPFMFAKVPYDTKRDLTFVTQIASGQLVLAVNPQRVPVKSMKEFVAWAAHNKGKAVYGSYGVGTVGHLMGAYMSNSRNLDMVHAPYKGEAPMLQDLVGGQIDWAVLTAGSAFPFTENGRLRALAVLGGQRLKEQPAVPTIAEAGFADPEFKTVGWIGLLAPAGVPAPVLERIEAAARAAVQATPVKARFQLYGMDGIGNSGADFRRDFEQTLPVMERLIKASGAKAD